MVEKGDPPFTIAWSKDGEAIAGPSPAAAGFGNTGITGPRHTQTPAGLRVTNIDAHSSTIVIERVSAAHSGNYTCMARNSVAEVLWTAELIVRGKVEPIIRIIKKPHLQGTTRSHCDMYFFNAIHFTVSHLMFLSFFFCTTANAPSYYIYYIYIYFAEYLLLALAGLDDGTFDGFLQGEEKFLILSVVSIPRYSLNFSLLPLISRCTIYSCIFYFQRFLSRLHFHSSKILFSHCSKFQVFFQVLSFRSNRTFPRAGLRTYLRFITLLLLSLVLCDHV